GVLRAPPRPDPGRVRGAAPREPLRGPGAHAPRPRGRQHRGLPRVPRAPGAAHRDRRPGARDRPRHRPPRRLPRGARGALLSPGPRRKDAMQIVATVLARAALVLT